jgi:hypothetical protein
MKNDDRVGMVRLIGGHRRVVGIPGRVIGDEYGNPPFRETVRRNVWDKPNKGNG